MTLIFPRGPRIYYQALWQSELIRVKQTTDTPYIWTSLASWTRSRGRWSRPATLTIFRGMTRMCRLAHGYLVLGASTQIDDPSPMFNAMSSERGQEYVCRELRREEEMRQLRPDCGYLTQDCEELIFYITGTNCIQYCIGIILFGRSAHHQCFTF